MIAVTGANGQLGRLVLSSLEKLQAGLVTALVRNPGAAQDLHSQTVSVRRADYDDPESLGESLAGIRTLLLISSSEIGRRAAQHAAIIEAAEAAGVTHLVYTSILNAPVSSMKLAQEHLDTEARLGRSGLSTVILRNSWYLENYLDAVRAAAAHGVLYGAAGDGRIHAATRADLAEAAARVLIDPASHAGSVYELAGQPGFTMADLAAAVSARAGRPVEYADRDEAGYAALLEGMRVPAPFADILADSDAAIRRGALASDSRDLAGLLGRPPADWSGVTAIVEP